MGMEQVNQQQLAVAGNLSATQTLEQVMKSELDRQSDTDNSSKVKTEESTLKKALDGKTANLGNEIIAGLAAKMAQLMPTARLISNIQDEFGLLADSREELKDDSVEIKTPSQFVTKTHQQKQNLGGGSGSSQEGSEEQQNQRADVKEYIGAYSQMLVSGGSEVRKKVEQMENRLIKEQGVPLKEVQHLKVQVANTVRQEILQQVKQSYLKQVLAKSKSVEWLIAKKESNNFIDFAFLNDAVGGYDFGGGVDGNLQGAVDSMQKDTHQELKEYVKDAMTGEVMKKAMGDEGKEVKKDIEALLKLGQKVGFDLNDFLAKIPKMKDDLGLNPAIEFTYVSADTEMGGDSRQGHRYQYTPDEEKEILTDKLRALYLKRALYGDVRTVLESQFKMVKLKNGLIRLGVKNYDEIENEGKALAKVKLIEMLREGFEERATYAKLSGEAWKMTERKIKTVLSNLERLGVKLTQLELDIVRDKANKKMHQEAEHELELIKMAIQARGEIKYLTSKKKMVVDILGRLAAETGLQKPGEELQLFVKEAC